MLDEPDLMIPGPVPLEAEIRDAMCNDVISHRSEAFKRVYRDCQRDLRSVLGTDNQIAFVNGSGTASMEAAVSNVVGNDDTVLCIKSGKFGRRFEMIAERYTDDLRTISVEWGQPVDLDEIETALGPEVSVVTMVHTDTSSGLTNPIEEVGQLAREHDAIFVVDAVTSAGSEEIRMDEWDVDVMVTASQKAIGGPPGISAVAANERARAAFAPESAPYYLDLVEHFSRADEHQTPTTSGVHAFLGFRKALEVLMIEGVDTRINRLDGYARAIREGGSAMGLPPYSNPDTHSNFANAVVLLEVPKGLDPNTLVDGIEARGIIIRTGLGNLADSTIRIGTMGAIDSSDVVRVLEALRSTLDEVRSEPSADGISPAKTVLEGIEDRRQSDMV